MDLISKMLDWEKVSDTIKKLSHDDSAIETLINEQLISVIKKVHPNDYREFIEKNKDDLYEIKSKLKHKYSNELRQAISFLYSADSHIGY